MFEERDDTSSFFLLPQRLHIGANYNISIYNLTSKGIYNPAPVRDVEA